MSTLLSHLLKRVYRNQFGAGRVGGGGYGIASSALDDTNETDEAKKAADIKKSREAEIAKNVSATVKPEHDAQIATAGASFGLQSAQTTSTVSTDPAPVGADDNNFNPPDPTHAIDVLTWLNHQSYYRKQLGAILPNSTLQLSKEYPKDKSGQPIAPEQQIYSPSVATGGLIISAKDVALSQPTLNTVFNALLAGVPAAQQAQMKRTLCQLNGINPDHFSEQVLQTRLALPLASNVLVHVYRNDVQALTSRSAKDPSKDPSKDQTNKAADSPPAYNWNANSASSGGTESTGIAPASASTYSTNITIPGNTSAMTSSAAAKQEAGSVAATPDNSTSRVMQNLSDHSAQMLTTQFQLLKTQPENFNAYTEAMGQCQQHQRDQIIALAKAKGLSDPSADELGALQPKDFWATVLRKPSLHVTSRVEIPAGASPMEAIAKMDWNKLQDLLGSLDHSEWKNWQNNYDAVVIDLTARLNGGIEIAIGATKVTMGTALIASSPATFGTTAAFGGLTVASGFENVYVGTDKVVSGSEATLKLPSAMIFKGFGASDAQADVAAHVVSTSLLIGPALVTGTVNLAAATTTTARVTNAAHVAMNADMAQSMVSGVNILGTTINMAAQAGGASKVEANLVEAGGFGALILKSAAKTEHSVRQNVAATTPTAHHTSALTQMQAQLSRKSGSSVVEINGQQGKLTQRIGDIEQALASKDPAKLQAAYDAAKQDLAGEGGKLKGVVAWNEAWNAPEAASDAQGQSSAANKAYNKLADYANSPSQGAAMSTLLPITEPMVKALIKTLVIAPTEAVMAMSEKAKTLYETLKQHGSDEAKVKATLDEASKTDLVTSQELVEALGLDEIDGGGEGTSNNWSAIAETYASELNKVKTNQPHLSEAEQLTIALEQALERVRSKFGESQANPDNPKEQIWVWKDQVEYGGRTMSGQAAFNLYLSTARNGANKALSNFVSLLHVLKDTQGDKAEAQTKKIAPLEAKIQDKQAVVDMLDAAIAQFNMKQGENDWSATAKIYSDLLSELETSNPELSETGRQAMAAEMALQSVRDKYGSGQVAYNSFISTVRTRTSNSLPMYQSELKALEATLGGKTEAQLNEINAKIKDVHAKIKVKQAVVDMINAALAQSNLRQGENDWAAISKTYLGLRNTLDAPEAAEQALETVRSKFGQWQANPNNPQEQIWVWKDKVEHGGKTLGGQTSYKKQLSVARSNNNLSLSQLQRQLKTLKDTPGDKTSAQHEQITQLQAKIQDKQAIVDMLDAEKTRLAENEASSPKAALNQLKIEWQEAKKYTKQAKNVADKNDGETMQALQSAQEAERIAKEKYDAAEQAYKASQRAKPANDKPVIDKVIKTPVAPETTPNVEPAKERSVDKGKQLLSDLNDSLETIKQINAIAQDADTARYLNRLDETIKNIKERISIAEQSGNEIAPSRLKEAEQVLKQAQWLTAEFDDIILSPAKNNTYKPKTDPDKPTRLDNNSFNAESNSINWGDKLTSIWCKEVIATDLSARLKNTTPKDHASRGAVYLDYLKKPGDFVDITFDRNASINPENYMNKAEYHKALALDRQENKVYKSLGDLAELTRMTGCEFGVVRTKDGRILLVRGSADSIDFAGLENPTVLVHTHPRATDFRSAMPSRADMLALVNMWDDRIPEQANTTASETASKTEGEAQAIRTAAIEASGGFYRSSVIVGVGENQTYTFRYFRDPAILALGEAVEGLQIFDPAGLKAAAESYLDTFGERNDKNKSDAINTFETYIESTTRCLEWVEYDFQTGRIDISQRDYSREAIKVEVAYKTEILHAINKIVTVDKSLLSDSEIKKINDEAILLKQSSLEASKSQLEFNQEVIKTKLALQQEVKRRLSKIKHRDF